MDHRSIDQSLVSVYPIYKKVISLSSGNSIDLDVLCITLSGSWMISRIDGSDYDPLRTLLTLQRLPDA